MPQIRIDMPAGAFAEAQELADLLQSGASGDSVEIHGDDRDQGIAPVAVFLIVAASVAAAGVITRVADWFQERRACLLVVDARNGAINIMERCDLDGQRGKTILITDEDSQLTIESQRGIIDLDELLKEAMTKSIDAAGALAKSAGATVGIGPAGEGL